MDKADFLAVSVGEFGPYQRKICILICLAIFLGACNITEMIFTCYSPEYECLNSKNILDSNHANIESYVIHENLCMSNSLNNISINDEEDGTNCSILKFDPSVRTTSIVTEFDLVCENDWKTAFSKSMYMMGNIFGVLLVSFFIDRYGRKLVLLISLTSMFIFKLCSIFINSFNMFAALRFLTGSVHLAAYSTAFVLASELVGIKSRNWISTIGSISWCLGCVTVGILAYFLRDRWSLELSTTILNFIVILIYWIIPESPRWLISKGEKDKAIRIVERMSELNGNEKRNTVDIFNSLLEDDAPVSNDSYRSILGSKKLMCWTLSLWLSWFSAGLCYYGMTFNISDLLGDLYLNVFLASLMELPLAIFMYPCLSTQLGHVKLIVLVQILAGLVMMIIPSLVANFRTASVILFILGKCLVIFCYNAMCILSSEMYPTTVRGGMNSISYLLSFIGSMVAPIIIMQCSTTVIDGLSYYIFGTTSIVAGLALLILPDTSDKPLPQTIDDVENIEWTFFKFKLTSRYRYSNDVNV